MINISKEDRSKPIILKIQTINSPAILNQIRKFINYFNHNLNFGAKAPLFIEDVEDGLLYIFQDLDAFYQIHQPFPRIPNILLKKLMKMKKFNDHLIVIDIITPANFPIEGLILIITCDAYPVQNLVETVEKYYSSIHKDIQVAIDEKNQIILRFTSYASVYKYFLIFYLYTQNNKLGILGEQLIENK